MTLSSLVYSDYRNNSLNLNNRGSIGAISIFNFLDLVMYYLLIVTIVVILLLVGIIWSTNRNVFSIRLFRENYVIEILWIVLRSLILTLIGIRSINLLYSLEEINEGVLTVKIVGVQWYWIYSIVDYKGNSVTFDSYTLSDDEISLFRLIEVDNRLYLRILTRIRLLVTSLDVILSWAIRSLGIKIDAVPCRLNGGNLFILRESSYIGYCSELCGINLSKMNIVVKGVTPTEYIKWFVSQ